MPALAPRLPTFYQQGDGLTLLGLGKTSGVLPTILAGNLEECQISNEAAESSDGGEDEEMKEDKSDDMELLRSASFVTAGDTSPNQNSPPNDMVVDYGSSPMLLSLPARVSQSKSHKIIPMEFTETDVSMIHLDGSSIQAYTQSPASASSSFIQRRWDKDARLSWQNTVVTCQTALISEPPSSNGSNTFSSPEVYRVVRGKELIGISLDDEFNRFFLTDALYQAGWISFIENPEMRLTAAEWGNIVPPLLYLRVALIRKKQGLVQLLIADFPLLVEPRGQKIQNLCQPFDEIGWVGVIKHARKAFSDGLSRSSLEMSSTLPSSTPHIQLLKNTCTLLKNQGFNNVMLNVSLAALHLSVLRLGVLMFGSGWQDFLKQIIQDPKSPLIVLRKVSLKNRLCGREPLLKIAQDIDACSGFLADVITAAYEKGGIDLQDASGPEINFQEGGKGDDYVSEGENGNSELTDLEDSEDSEPKDKDRDDPEPKDSDKDSKPNDNDDSDPKDPDDDNADPKDPDDDSDPKDPDDNDSGPKDPDDDNAGPKDPDIDDSDPKDPDDDDADPGDLDDDDSEQKDPNDDDSEQKDPDYEDSNPGDPNDNDSDPNDPDDNENSKSNNSDNETEPKDADENNEGSNMDIDEDGLLGGKGQEKDKNRDDSPLGKKRKPSTEPSAEEQERIKVNFNSGIVVGDEHRLFDYNWETFVDFTPISQDEYGLKVFENAVKLVNTTALIDSRAQGEKLAPKNHAIEVVQYRDWISKDFPPARRQAIFHSRYMEVLLGEEILYSKHTMQDLALLKEHNNPSFNPNDSHFEATLEELIRSAEIRQAIINCLDIPIPSTKAPGCQGLATQAEAEGHIKERVDQEGMYWAIAGQKGAYSLLHMDANGLCTVVEPKNGLKYWVIARPKNDVMMSSIGLLDVLDVELENMSKLWDFYAVILQPGDIFIMRPATPHYVMTLEDSLCFGSHCYSSQTLTQTSLGIYHALTTGDLITNMSHPNALEGLCHIALWWYSLIVHPEEILLKTVLIAPGSPLAHKPNFTTVEDVIGFLDLVNLVTLAPVLDVRGYVSKAKGSSKGQYMLDNTRKLYEKVRPLVEEMKEWLFSHFEMGLVDGVDKLQDADCLETLSQRYLIQQCQALVWHKRRAEGAGIGGENQEVKSGLIKLAIEKNFARDKSFLRKWKGAVGNNDADRLKKDSEPSYSWPRPPSGHYVMWSKDMSAMNGKGKDLPRQSQRINRQVSIEMEIENRAEIGDDERMLMDIDMTIEMEEEDHGIPQQKLDLKRVCSTRKQQTSNKRQRVMVDRQSLPPRNESMGESQIEVDMTGYRRIILPGRNEEIFGQVWATDRHVLVKDKNPGTIYIIVMDWSRESMLRLHKASANEDETLGTKQEISKKGFLIAIPEKNDFIVWRSKYGSGEQKDDIVKSWSMSKKDHSEDHLSVMDNVQSDLYGPVEDEYEGAGGIEAGIHSWCLQLELEELGRTCSQQQAACQLALQCSVKGNIVGLSKVDPSLTRHLDNQAELTNCARIGSIDNRYWTGAQLNVGSLDREPENVDKGEGSEKNKDKGKGKSQEDSGGNIRDIGQFGGPHEDGGDHECGITAMLNWTRPHKHVKTEYFTIFDAGACWRLDQYCMIYFSGLHYHSGAAAIPKPTFNFETMVYTRITLIMYPSVHEFEGDSQLALGLIPKDTHNGLLTLNKEMRNFGSHAYEDKGVSSFGSYISDGLVFMDDKSYLNHLSRNMLSLVAYLVRQAPIQNLVWVDKNILLSAFSMRSGNERIGADQWEMGPGWMGEDTRVGKEYMEDFSKLSDKEWNQLWNSDTFSDTLFGNKAVPAQKEEWAEYRKKAMSVLPICHATNELIDIDEPHHHNYHRMIRASATRAARRDTGKGGGGKGTKKPGKGAPKPKKEKGKGKGM
ncbi:hypothetical protein F5050DRAFT_1866001 [Lentinula boryana]|uniref:JmjC domain-containing protein n=1 Tax=Lentinula boryana TaxID=40481 RepID=A0ABQ8PYZ4_9AGAR|nr:hypothetical protein F5050DRAFT_1866001 [Lentinula boryana]